MVNQIDLGKIYGLQGCPQSRFYNLGSQFMNYPDLEQLDSYPNIPRTEKFYFPQNPNSNSVGNGTAGDNPIDDYGDGSTQYSADYPTPKSDTNGTASEGVTDAVASQGYPVSDVGTVQRSSPIREGMNMHIGSGTTPPKDKVEQRGYDVTSADIRYLNNFMRTQIGRLIEVNFVIGGETMMRVAGYLMGVGDDFVLINEYGTNNVTACDYYNIKYVRIFY